MESDLRPRLCFLTKGECGYGFHLHGERKKGGQFIRKVEPGSSADLSGLRPGDRVVEVNGDNVETETHHQVVHRICEVEHRTRLLVVDRETDDYLRSQGLACSEDLAIEMGTYSPRPSPRPTPTASPILKENGAISPASILMHLAKASSPRPSPMPTPTASPTPIENGPISPASILMHSAKAPAIPSPSPSPSLTHSPSTHTERSSTHTERSSMTSSSMTDTELPLDTSPELPETTVELLPRLCHLVKGGHGYGFNLHSGKTHRGQFIRSVDPGSTADRADVRPGDRLLEVNGVNIEGMRHSEVVAFIRAGGEEVSLLVVDQDTDDLFQRLGVIPTISHIKEVYVDEPITESTPPTPSPTTNLPAADHLPIIDITLTDHSITNTSPKLRTNGSSASQSSRDSNTHSEFSSSDVSIQVPEEDDRRVSDPYLENGLRLSPTAAEAKEKVKRNKKRAPPMDWSKKYEIFSNL